MFNVGGGELLVIMLVALIVLGPQRLPDAARQVGRVMGDLRRISSGFQQELKDAFDHDDDASVPTRRKESVPLAATVAEADSRRALAASRATDVGAGDDADTPAADTGARPSGAPLGDDRGPVAPAVAAALDEIVTSLDPSPSVVADPEARSSSTPGEDDLGDERAAS